MTAKYNNFTNCKNANSNYTGNNNSYIMILFLVLIYAAKRTNIKKIDPKILQKKS